MEIKALTLQNPAENPWATWVMDGSKTLEIRTWPTRYRGLLLITVSKSPKCAESGMAIGVVKLVSCRPMTVADEEAARCPCDPGDWAWVLRDPKRITPFPVRGQLGIWDAEMPDGTEE